MLLEGAPCSIKVPLEKLTSASYSVPRLLEPVFMLQKLLLLFIYRGAKREAFYITIRYYNMNINEIFYCVSKKNKKQKTFVSSNHYMNNIFTLDKLILSDHDITHFVFILISFLFHFLFFFLHHNDLFNSLRAAFLIKAAEYSRVFLFFFEIHELGKFHHLLHVETDML